MLQGIYELASRPDLDKNGQPAKFAEELRSLMGEDFSPDAQFFQEAWTYNLAVAVENWQRRQEKLPEDDFQSSAEIEDDDVFEIEAIVYEGSSPEEYYGHLPRSAEESEDEDAVVLSEEEGALIAPESAPAEPTKSVQKDHRKKTAPVRYMTPYLAQTLLGVQENSSLAEIKVAYHRMAGLWHPDLLKSGTEEYRIATEQMATINDAYRVLRDRCRT